MTATSPKPRPPVSLVAAANLTPYRKPFSNGLPRCDVLGFLAVHGKDRSPSVNGPDFLETDGTLWDEFTHLGHDRGGKEVPLILYPESMKMNLEHVRAKGALDGTKLSLYTLTSICLAHAVEWMTERPEVRNFAAARERFALKEEDTPKRKDKVVGLVLNGSLEIVLPGNVIKKRWNLYVPTYVAEAVAALSGKLGGVQLSHLVSLLVCASLANYRHSIDYTVAGYEEMLSDFLEQIGTQAEGGEALMDRFGISLQAAGKGEP